MSSERGIDNRDVVKNMRDRARYNIAYSKDVDMRRPDTFRNNPKDIGKLKVKTPVISNRGSDLKDQVLEGRKKAQYNKANSGFMRFTTPVDTKIQQGTYF
jgi:hypothetical protein